MTFIKLLFRSSLFNWPGKKHQVSRRFQHNLQNETLKKLIENNTVKSREHLTPELILRLITPECELWHAKATESTFPNDPFWGIYWPGGQALGRYILDNKNIVKQKNVLDIGSGSGACAIASVKAGAHIVLANDTDEASIVAITINSLLNNSHVHTCKDDVIGKNIDDLTILIHGQQVTPKWDVILVGDMFYDTDFSQKLFTWLIELVKMRKTVFVGDPGRHALQDINTMSDMGSLIKVAEYNLKNTEHNGFPNASVFKVEAA